MTEEKLAPEQPNDIKTTEYLKIIDILVGVGKEFGFNPTSATSEVWRQIARCTR